MTTRQREPRLHDEVFLDRLRQLPCIVPRCQHASEAAHIRMASAAHGIVESGHAKPHDALALPCCAFHHRLSNSSEHSVGTQNFWRGLRMDPHGIALRLYRAHATIDNDIQAVNAMRMIVLEERFAAQ